MKLFLRIALQTKVSFVVIVKRELNPSMADAILSKSF